MSGYYGYSNGPTDIEELWTEIRKLRTRISDLEKGLHPHRRIGTPHPSGPVKDLDV